MKKVFESAYASVADRAMPTRRLPELFASARMDVQALQSADCRGRNRAPGIELEEQPSRRQRHWPATRRAPEKGRRQTGRLTATRDEPIRCLEYVRLRDGNGQRGAATTGSGTETE